MLIALPLNTQAFWLKDINQDRYDERGEEVFFNPRGDVVFNSRGPRSLYRGLEDGAHDILQLDRIVMDDWDFEDDDDDYDDDEWF